VVTISRVSPITGRTAELTLDIPEAQFEDAYTAWQSGTLLQDAFFFLTPGEREFIKTGISPTEWELFFGEEE
jgi:hypothetical protein